MTERREKEVKKGMKARIQKKVRIKERARGKGEREVRKEKNKGKWRKIK